MLNSVSHNWKKTEDIGNENVFKKKPNHSIETETTKHLRPKFSIFPPPCNIFLATKQKPSEVKKLKIIIKHCRAKTFTKSTTINYQRK